jgi:transposase
VRALGEQTVVVTGTDAAALVLPQLAEQLALVLAQRQRVAEQLQKLVDEHAVSSRLLTMPGVGFRTAARIVVETSGRHFATPGHLAAFAGLAPVTHRSGTSIRGERSPRRGNRRLKRALYLSAFAALKDPTSRAYYNRKRTERKTHQAALLALARRRSDVLFAMLRDGSEYDAQHALAA